MAEIGPPPFTGPDDPLDNAWLLKALRTLFVGLNSPDVAAADVWRQVEGKAAEVSAEVAEHVDMWTGVSKAPLDEIGTYLKLAQEVIQYVVTNVTGLSIPGGTVTSVMEGGSTEVTRLTLGNIFVTLLDETLLTDGVAAGWKDRLPGTPEGANMARLVGAAFRLQLGDMVTGWAAKAIPFGLGEGFTEIAERIDKAINLDDAIEDIIQVPMQAVISRGLEAYYNRLIKPADLSASEALKAEIAGKLNPGDLTKILDNAGYRDDIRQILRDNAAGNLTESDLNDGYQWNLLTRDDVKKRYRDNAFEEPDAELKTKLVELTRRQRLREKVFELYGNLYRDGVATKQEVTPFLESYGYDADEVEMWFQVQELERRQRKWISDGNVLKLIMRGEWTSTDAISYQVLQGMEANDAFAFISLAVKEEKEQEVKAVEREVKAVIAKLPKAVKDKCEDLLKPEDLLTELLGQLVTLVPGELLGIPGASKLKTYIECVLKEILNPGP